VAKFKYTAKDKTGKSVTGTLEVSDQKAAADELRKQELIIISIQAFEDKAKEKKKDSAAKPKKSGRKVKLTELVLFSRQLATMIDSGIPLVQTLEILTEQVDQPVFKAVIHDVQKDVSSGSAFYEALAKHPNAFTPFFVNMVKAGESSGSLDDIMDRLAAYLEKTDSLIRKVRSAMIYPIVVTVVAIVITLGMMLFIVPTFKSIFADFGGKLPLPTLILIAISDFLIHFFFVWFSAFVIGLFLLRRFLKTKEGTALFDRFKLAMPIFGIIMRKTAVSKFSRTLSTLIKSGVPILSALEIVSRTAGNTVIEAAVDKVRTSIREGENITTPLARSKVFPPMVVRMIAVGEQTGELEKMLTKIADFYDDEVDTAISGITSVIEPLVIVFLGVVIGGIVICMFLPIFQLSTLVQN